MPAPESQPPVQKAGNGLVPAAALGVCTIGFVCFLSSIGQVQGPGGNSAAAGILTTITLLLHGGLFALAYLLGAVGLGRLPAAIFARGMESRLWLQAALGVGLMLWASHLLGCFGLLSGDGMMPRIAAWLPISIGLALLLDQMLRGELMPEKWPPLPRASVLVAPALATLLVAAANAPGWLWSSEFGAYDALSYHLQLPKEWAVGAGGIAPSAHNVYSYLPGYVEAAYLHLAQMMVGVGGGGVVERMLGGDGIWVYSCQLLHALMGVLAALLCGRGAWAVAKRSGAGDGAAALTGLAAAIVILGTGWTIVCASLAYNELGVVLLAAGALLLCVDASRPARAFAPHMLRCMGIGLLVGLATSCKPTALLLVGPAAGILMLGTLERKKWVRAVVAGSIGGLIAIAPWLIRNAVASGNPVFPVATGVFGLGHWTAEQAARYAHAHAFDGSIFERFAMLFSSRGWMHAQWGATPWLVLAAAIIALVRARTHIIAVLLIGGVACGLIAWLFATHLQSRFLVPLLPPMAMLLGAGIAAIGVRADAGQGAPSSDREPSRLGLLALAGVPVILSMLGFVAQRGGAPNALLVGGVAEFTGSLRAENVYFDLTPGERAATLNRAAGPYELINLAINPAVLGGETRAAVLGLASDLPADEPKAVYLLGDATPLYYLGATGGGSAGVVYHTTWEASPLGDAIRAAPGRPGAWTDALRARGIGFVLLNLDELLRLIDQDHNFDPDVTKAQIEVWLSDPAAGCRVMRAWDFDGANGPRPGRVLVRLLAPADRGQP